MLGRRRQGNPLGLLSSHSGLNLELQGSVKVQEENKSSMVGARNHVTSSGVLSIHLPVLKLPGLRPLEFLCKYWNAIVLLILLEYYIVELF